jgi:hypothetical protein
MNCTWDSHFCKQSVLQSTHGTLFYGRKGKTVTRRIVSSPPFNTGFNAWKVCVCMTALFLTYDRPIPSLCRSKHLTIRSTSPLKSALKLMMLTVCNSLLQLVVYVIKDLQGRKPEYLMLWCSGRNTAQHHQALFGNDHGLARGNSLHQSQHSL